jgi:glycerophosphoryl diester phosphodiesterase
MGPRAFGQAAIGHRGAGFRYPENTLVAMRAAVSARLAASEMDVRLTKDTVAILMHDPTVDRTTNGTGTVEQLTAAQVQALDAGAKTNRLFTGEHVPC